MFDPQNATAHKVENTADLATILRPEQNTLAETQAVTGFSVDSRTLKRGEVFIAIPGKRSDGHRFLSEAQAKGAAACLVSDWDMVGDQTGCLLVPDTVKALGFLAASHRKALKAKIIGLTGSVGKTTTKDLLHALLSMNYRTRKSEGNFNSTIGLPIQILNLTEEDEWMVAEMGMSTPGEIRTLMEIVNPDYGLWLSVQAVHLANFKNIEEIAEAKAELVQGLDPDRTLIYNRDDPLVHQHAKDYSGYKLTYGVLHPDADVNARIEPFPTWKGTHFEIRLKNGFTMPFFLPITGRYNAVNALAACAVIVAAGLPIQEMSHAFSNLTLPKGRSNLLAFKDDILLVDDTYNANPYAVSRVLRCFASLSPNNYRWIVLGDMLEMGPDEIQIHRELGRTLARQGFDRVTLVGPLARHAYDAFQESNPGSVEAEYFQNTGEAVQKMNPDAPAKARIWCKASRGIHLEHAVNRLITHFSDKQGPPYAL